MSTPAARSAEPTGELREQVRRRVRISGASGEVAAIAADALMASEIAPLLAKLQAVEALAEAWEAARDHYAAPIVEAARELRRALDAS